MTKGELVDALSGGWDDALPVCVPTGETKGLEQIVAEIGDVSVEFFGDDEYGIVLHPMENEPDFPTGKE